MVAADALPADLAAAWRQIQDQASELRHPMLAAAYVQCIARHRAGVEVAVIRSNSGIVGFFPFQRDGAGVGRPVGYRLNDYQAAVLAPGVDASIDAGWLLRQCGLRVWHFDHLLPSQRCFAAGHFSYEDSPYIDLSQGLQACLEGITGPSRLNTLRRKARRMEREVGPLRFEFHTTEVDPFRTLLEWKSRQVRRDGRRCVFDWPWVQDTLHELRGVDDAACMGTLSALYAGDQLAAAHLGLRSQDVLHWWITAYNPDLSRHSPGAQLLVRLMAAAEPRGLKRIDLGKGVEPYKTDFQSGAMPLATGAVGTSLWTRVLQRTAYAVQDRVRSSPLAPLAKKLAYRLEARKHRER